MVGAESIPMAVVRKTLEALEKAGYITSFKGILVRLLGKNGHGS